MSTLVATTTSTSPINLEDSWGERTLSSGTGSIMRLYLNTDDTGYIEWEVPELDLYEDIGLTFEFDPKGKRTLVDYDGVMSMPKQALKLLTENGIDTGEITA